MKPYPIIYADPAWPYSMELGSKKGAENPMGYAHITEHYPTMTMEDIAKLPVHQLAADDCLLFMWVVSPLLPKCIKVGSHWGFEYVTIGFVWFKGKVHPGHYTLGQCELCLIFKKGKIPQPRGSRGEKQFIDTLRTAHSAKPEAARRRIERMFPTQRKLELFARVRPPGWDVWGNQAPESIEWNGVKPLNSTEAKPLKQGLLF